MRKAGQRSLWAPLSSSSSSSSATPSTDRAPPADKLKTSPRPARTLDLLDELSATAAADRSGFRRPSGGTSDFYRRYSEHWARTYDRGRSCWEEEAEEEGDEDAAEKNDDDDDDDDKDEDAADSSATCCTEEDGHGYGYGKHEEDGHASEGDEDEDEDRGLLQHGRPRARREEPPHHYEMASWSGQPDIRGRTEWVRMMLLCAVHFGITFTWGVEMTYCTPYLLNLGLTKSQTSLVWIAGPLSGLITQPIVGALADSSRSRWGRRRPYIVVGSLIVAGGLMTLGWTKEMVALVMATDTDFAKMLIIFLAVLALYVTDFAINAVMSCSRSLLVDTLPIAKQQTGAAWAGRMGSLGHIVGYGMGAVDLPGTFGTRLGATQFQQLTLIAALGILATAATTCWAVTERVLIAPAHHYSRDSSAAAARAKVLRQIWSTFLDLPPRIQGICWAVFWGWIGWFPFNVYSSTWVGETYFRYDAQRAGGADASSAATLSSSDALGDMGRIGSYTLTIYSAMTFAGAWLLPLFVRAPEDEGFTRRPPARIAHLVSGLDRLKPELLTVWVVGHALFASAMVFAPFATSFRFATVLVVFCGIPWSIVSWAPVAMMGMEVNKISGGAGGGESSYRRLSNAPPPPSSEAVGMELLRGGLGGGGGAADAIHVEHGPDPPEGAATTGELSGIYFGILNIYQTIPQFIGTFISTVVFAVLEPGKSPELAADAPASEHHATDGPNAIAVCLFIGAGAAVVAAVVTRRLRYIP